MSFDKETEQALIDISRETEKAHEEAQTFVRKLLKPTWEKRREIVKNIPNFWAQAVGSSPLFNMMTNAEDIQALESLVDLHVEHDDERPNYRKVIATFKKNDVFKNDVLIKEYIIGNDQDEILTKTTIEYHPGMEPSNKRKRDEDEEDFTLSFHEWFNDDMNRPGFFISEDIFPSAIDLFNGDSEDDMDGDDIELGSDDEEDDEEEEEEEEEEDEKPTKKSKSKK
ncbi:hypothetical protein BDF14DRAFT_1795717 [Spinellus fusiger]|nr:hypothetical protein BDF14DRAFT_1795717 [Spinellus fusiger]